jgi:2-polyprenyl-3-methyl-5-hydroxy-6-metoxy-1,4-benzoquinol methylase
MTYKKQLQVLQEKYNKLKEDRQLLLTYSNEFIHFFETSITPQGREAAHKGGCYHFIPSSISGVISNLKLVKKYLDGKNVSEAKFIDAGCGIGNVTLLANLFGFAADGVEIDARNVRIAKAITKHRSWYSIYSSKIIKGDILTFKHYSKYDVIYFYCPLSDCEKQIHFEKKVADEAKVGAVIIGVLSRSAFEDNKQLKRIKDGYPIWVKTDG